MDFLSLILESVSAFLATDPTVIAAQLLMGSCAFLVVFLVLFTTRDVLLRTHSFLMQAFCILLTAAMPIVGFFLYLLIRPSRTIAERAMHRDIGKLLSKIDGGKKSEKSHKSQVVSHKS